MEGNAAVAVAERADKRLPAQLRPSEAVVGVVTRADGSTRYSQGKTQVVVSVRGPGDVLIRNEHAERASIEIIWKPVTGQASMPQRADEQRLQHMVEGIVMCELHPRTTIQIVVQEVHNDGSLFASAVNATCLALMDAGIPMRMCCAAAEAAVVDGQLVLDPTAAEEAASTATLQLAYSNKAAVDDVLLCNSAGVLTQAQLAAGTAAAFQASKVCFAFFRKFAEQRLLAPQVRQQRRGGQGGATGSSGARDSDGVGEGGSEQAGKKRGR